MLRNVSLVVMCIVLGGLGSMGCKEKAAEVPLECKPAPQPAVSPSGFAGRMKFARRPNGDFALMSSDGKQVIIVQPEGYQVCEPASEKLICGPLTPMTNGCTTGEGGQQVCPQADPCPCTRAVCRPLCHDQ